MSIRVAGHLLLCTSDSAWSEHPVSLSPGALIVRNGLIEKVDRGERAMTASSDFGGPECLISPGFVDAHLHLPQFDSIGVPGLELLEWLDRVVFPAEARWEDVSHAAEMTRRVGHELLSFGTTSIAAYATVHHAAAQAAIDILGDMGFSGHVGQVLMDREAPRELLRPAAQLLEEAASLRDCKAVRASINPRFAITCSGALLEGCGRLAAASGRLIQTHYAETPTECRRLRELHAESYTSLYGRAGLLTPRSLLAHAVHVDDADRRRLAAAGAIVAHCPTANRFLRSGAMDLSAHRSHHLLIALGSDVAGGPERSMIRVARAMLETAEALGHTPPTAAQAWAAMTRGNALALGLEDRGRLAPGSRADLLVIKPTPGWLAAPDPLARLMYAWDDRWLAATILDGRAVYRP